MARKNQRKQEQEPAMKIDRISDLKDSLLCQILSLLPTVTSVSTCALSRRWRHVWKHLQTFEFIDKFYDPNNGEAPSNFVQFVNTVLILRKVKDIQKFSLSCDAINIEHEVTAWIHRAIGPNLQELNITIGASSGPLNYLLPSNVFTCTTLVSLSLQGLISFDHLSSIHLPSLKNLVLGLSYENPTEKLLVGCPVLENLVLRRHVWSSRFKYMPPILKRLTFEDGINEKTESLGLHFLPPSLAYINITLHDTICRKILASDLDNVMEAHLDIFPHVEHVRFVPKLLNMFYRLRYLKLKIQTVRCLLNNPNQEFPMFSRLLHLKLEIPAFNLGLVIKFLHYCPSLRNLHVQSMEVDPSCETWTKPCSVPYSLGFRLKHFVFTGYRNLAEENAFAKYMLDQALILETAKIYCDNAMDLEEKYHTLKELSATRRSSIECRLIFD